MSKKKSGAIDVDFDSLSTSDMSIDYADKQRGRSSYDDISWNDFTDQIITINVAGKRFQTFLKTLERYPDTLLGSWSKRSPFYNSTTNEYFFDRHRRSFDSILYFYQSGGILQRPRSVSVDTFVNELKFFDVGDAILEQFWRDEGYVKPEADILPKHPLKQKIWLWIEHPDTSIFARIIGFLSISVILVSTVSFCLETLPEFKAEVAKLCSNSTPIDSETMHICWKNPFYIVEVICIIWFTFEFVVRLSSCPSPKQFCMSFLNWVDFLAIAPFFINLALKRDNQSTMSFAVLRVLRLIRVFRIFKLSRHSRGLRVLGETFKASLREIILLVFLIIIAMILFSSVIYYAEQDEPHNNFTSIPEGFWYAVVTMTTVGYGDITPKGPLGRLVGMFCALVGVLVIALPVPVIVENFKHFYRQEQRLTYMAQLAEEANLQVQLESPKTEASSGARD